MSEENNAPIVDEVPQELKELQIALSDLAQYRNAVTLSSFPGGQADAVKKLRDFLKETYEQVFKQFNDHPYVIDMKAREAKQV
jgi:hypothetical protein